MQQLDQEFPVLVQMVSRLVFLFVVWGLLSFQGVLRISAARTVFDVTGISSERSVQNSNVDEGFQQNWKSTGCMDGTGTTFAVQSELSQVNRVLVDSSCLRDRQLLEGPRRPSSSDPGPNDPPGSG